MLIAELGSVLFQWDGSVGVCVRVRVCVRVLLTVMDVKKLTVTKKKIGN